MFKKTDEVKVLRDPVHGYIHVEYEVIWNCINSKWMQRLRRVHQLGGGNMVYHAADHSRFQHSLGVYEIVRRMVTEVPDISDALNEKEKMIVMLAGLMHDIGHGPYSHAFESVSKLNHETYTCRIIEEDPEIHDLLEDCDQGMAKEVADVIRHTSTHSLLPQLISSQLDADRMDYLLRDAYFTGTKYGEFDLERILRTLRVQDDRIVVKESGVYAVENYIMARYHMYWQVYFHPIARSFDCMVNRIFKRMRDLYEMGQLPKILPEFETIASGEELSLNDYFKLDEYACSYGFGLLLDCEDAVLRDLAGRLRNRDLFDYCEETDENIKRIRASLQQRGLDERYYLALQTVDQRPYNPYKLDEQGSSIWIRMHGGEIRELSQASNLVSSMVNTPMLKDNRIFFPK